MSSISSLEDDLDSFNRKKTNVRKSSISNSPSLLELKKTFNWKFCAGSTNEGNLCLVKCKENETFCNKHNSICNKLYKKYKQVCKNSTIYPELQFLDETFLEFSFQKYGINKLYTFQHKIEFIIKSINTCIEERKIHTELCVHPTLQNQGHITHVNNLSNKITNFNKSLVLLKSFIHKYKINKELNNFNKQPIKRNSFKNIFSFLPESD